MTGLAEQHSARIGVQPHYAYRKLRLPASTCGATPERTAWQSRAFGSELVLDCVGAAPPLPRGGILGDEMGLGKTVTMLALFLVRRRPVVELAAATFPEALQWRAGVPRPTGAGVSGGGGGGARRSQRVALIELGADEREVVVPPQPVGATLVVAPQTLVAQWHSELGRHAPTLRVLTYRGMDGATWARSFAGADVVLTSYEVLRRELPRGPRQEKWASPLLHVQWWRVALDEAQTVSSGTSNTARMCALLERRHSWCVTGTPLAAGVNDLRGLFNFIGFAPFASESGVARVHARNAAKYFRCVVADPVRAAQRDGAHMVEALLRACMWRVRKSDVQHCLQLPPCEVRNEWVVLAPLERAHYDHAHEEGARLVRSLACAECGELAAHSEQCARGQRADAAALSLAAARRTCAAPSAKRRRREARSGAGPERTAKAHRVGRMLLHLRQTCCHPRIVTGGAARGRSGDAASSSIADIATHMCDAAKAVLVRERRGLARALAHLAQHPLSRGRRALVAADRALRIVGPPSDLGAARIELDALRVVHDTFGRFCGSDATSVAPAPTTERARSALEEHFSAPAAQDSSSAAAVRLGSRGSETSVVNWWMVEGCRDVALRRLKVLLRLERGRERDDAAAAARLARERRTTTVAQSAVSQSQQAQAERARVLAAEARTLHGRCRRYEERAGEVLYLLPLHFCAKPSHHLTCSP